MNQEELKKYLMFNQDLQDFLKEKFLWYREINYQIQVNMENGDTKNVLSKRNSKINKFRKVQNSILFAIKAKKESRKKILLTQFVNQNQNIEVQDNIPGEQQIDLNQIQQSLKDLQKEQNSQKEKNENEKSKSLNSSTSNKEEIKQEESLITQKQISVPKLALLRGNQSLNKSQIIEPPNSSGNRYKDQLKKIINVDDKKRSKRMSTTLDQNMISLLHQQVEEQAEKQQSKQLQNSQIQTPLQPSGIILQKLSTQQLTPQMQPIFTSQSSQIIAAHSEIKHQLDQPLSENKIRHLKRSKVSFADQLPLSPRLYIPSPEKERIEEEYQSPQKPKASIFKAQTVNPNIIEGLVENSPKKNSVIRQQTQGQLNFQQNDLIKMIENRKKSMMEKNEGQQKPVQFADLFHSQRPTILLDDDPNSQFQNRLNLFKKRTSQRRKASLIQTNFTIIKEEESIPKKKFENLDDIDMDDEAQFFDSPNMIVRESFEIFLKPIKKRPEFDNNLHYFDQGIQKKVYIEFCYLNPFGEKTQIYCDIAKKDGSYFLVIINLLLKNDLSSITMSTIQQKDQLNVQIQLKSFNFKSGSTNINKKVGSKIQIWEDSVIISFKDFIKWFAKNFLLIQFIEKYVKFDSEEKLEIQRNLNQNIQIQDCKLKLEYFNEKQFGIKKKQKKQKMKQNRRSVYIEQMMKYEEYFKREFGHKKYENSLSYFLNHETLGKYYEKYYLELQDMRIKLNKNNSRKESRMIQRKSKLMKQSYTSNEDVMKFRYIFDQSPQRQYTGPEVAKESPDEQQQHILKKELGSGIIKNSSMQNQNYFYNQFSPLTQILGQYNSIRYLHQNKYIFNCRNHHFQYSYFSMKFQTSNYTEQLKLQIYQPFSKQKWHYQILSNLTFNKFINLYQIDNDYKISQGKQSSFYACSDQYTNLRQFMLQKNFQVRLSLSGKRLSFRYENNSNFKNLTLDENFLLNYLISNNQSNVETNYKFLELIKISLLNSYDFWNIYFTCHKFLQHAKIRNLGYSIVEYLIYIDKLKYYLKDNSQRFCFVKLNIFKKENMRTQSWKVTLNLVDIKLLYKKISKEFNLNEAIGNLEEFIKDISFILNEYMVFTKQGMSRVVSLEISNLKHASKYCLYFKILISAFILHPQFPWIPNFHYNDYQFKPYSDDQAFFHMMPERPRLICDYLTFFKIPNLYQRVSKGDYTTPLPVNADIYLPLSQPLSNLILTPVIITIFQSDILKSFFVQLYFPKTQRRLIAQINYSEIYKYNEFAELIAVNNKLIWLQIAAHMEVQQNEYHKMLLKLSNFNLTLILSECLYFGVKKLIQQEQQKQALIQVTIEMNQFDEEMQRFHLPFPKIRIMEAKNYSLYLKVQQLSRMQACKIPFPELLVGYYKKMKKTKKNLFEFTFNQKEIIKLCENAVEMVSLNWSHTSQISTMLPLEHVPKSKQSMKINGSISLSQVLQFVKNQYILMYRGILMSNTMMAIFFRKNKEHLYIVIQRLSDCKQFSQKVNYEEIEKQLPGFIQCLKSGIKEKLGRRLFFILKNKMIVQCYYKF